MTEHVLYHRIKGVPEVVSAVQYDGTNAEALESLGTTVEPERHGRPWALVADDLVIEVGQWLVVTASGEVLVLDDEPQRAEWEYHTHDYPCMYRCPGGDKRRLRGGPDGDWEEVAE